MKICGIGEIKRKEENDLSNYRFQNGFIKLFFRFAIHKNNNDAIAQNNND